MDLIKYDKLRDDNGNLIIFNNNNNNNSSENNPPSRSGGELNRTIWGQEDIGENIDGNMIVNGDIHIKFITEPTFTPEEDDVDDGIIGEYDDEYDVGAGGNLIVEGDITCSTLNADTIKFNYPTLEDSKKNLRDLLKGFDTRITGNTTDITNIKSEISDLWDAIPEKVSQLENDKGYITADELPTLLPENDKFAPVILFSGRLYSYNNDNTITWGSWYVSGARSCQHSGISNLTASYTNKSSNIPSLKLNLTTKDGYYCKITSVSSQVVRAVDYDPKTSTGANHRSKGYWMTGGVDNEDDYIYLNAWRTGDQNNDTTNLDCLAYRVQEISITIYGQCYKTISL